MNSLTHTTGAATPAVAPDKHIARSDPAALPPAAPVQTKAAVAPMAPTPSPAEVKEALQTINSSMRELSRKLEFSVDPDSDRVIVRIVDQQTNEIIRQMPTREALDIAKAIDMDINKAAHKTQGLLLSQKV